MISPALRSVASRRLAVPAASASRANVTLGRRFASGAAAAPTVTQVSRESAMTEFVPQNLAPGEEIDPQLNGYPQLPNITIQKREPFGWWDQQERKNFGEVIHESEDVLGMWGPDVHKTSGSSALFQLTLAFSGIALVAYGLIKTRPERPAAARSYPYGGLEKELGGQFVARKEEVDEE